MMGRSEVWRWSRSTWPWPVGMEDREVTSVMSTWQCHGEEKCERLEEEGVSFFNLFLIESHQFVLLI